MPSINEKVVIGFRELRRELEDLPKRVVKNVVRKAVYAGASVVRDAARAKVAVDTGALRSSIVAKSNTNAKTGEISASVGVQRKTYVRGKKKGKSPRRYAHLVEFGTIRSAAQPFLRPAIDTQIDEILAATAKKMREGIDAEAAKSKAKKT